MKDWSRAQHWIKKLPIWLAISELKLGLFYSYQFLMVVCRPLGDSIVRRTNNAPKVRRLRIRIFCDAIPGLMLLNKLLKDQCKSKRIYWYPTNLYSGIVSWKSDLSFAGLNSNSCHLPIRNFHMSACLQGFWISKQNPRTVIIFVPLHTQMAPLLFHELICADVLIIKSAYWHNTCT